MRHQRWVVMTVKFSPLNLLLYVEATLSPIALNNCRTKQHDFYFGESSDVCGLHPQIPMLK